MPSSSKPMDDTDEFVDDFYGVSKFQRDRSRNVIEVQPASLSNAVAFKPEKVRSDSVFSKYQEVKVGSPPAIVNDYGDELHEDEEFNGDGNHHAREFRSNQDSKESSIRSFKAKERTDSTTKSAKLPQNNSKKSFAVEVGESDEFGHASRRPSRAAKIVAEFRNQKEVSKLPTGNGPRVSVRRDSKGFRVFDYDVNELEAYTEDELTEVLLRNVVYEDDCCVVLNKPNGLDTIQSTSKHSVEALLPRLAHRLNQLSSNGHFRDSKGEAINFLSLVHRLDRQTTGCLLLAKHEEALLYLKAYFAERRIIKRYLCVARGKPHAEEGQIDVPIGPARIGGIERMFVYPQAGANDPRYALVARFRDSAPRSSPSSFNSSSNRIREASTRYRVLSSNCGASLVECEPSTGIRHQVRVHMAYVLECPILGDHKYSHVMKLAPQKLNAEMLRALGMRQAKVRNIPMHLHAASLCLPHYYGDARNLHVSAPLPNFFRSTLKWLKLSFK